MENEDKTDKGPIIGMRHVQTIFLFTCLASNAFGRQCISVTIVAMNNASSANPDFKDYQWTARQRSYVLGSFFWGFISMVLPSGLIVRRFGTKKMLFLSTFATAVTSLFTPLFVDLGGWQLLTVLRMIQGIFQCFLPASVSQHLANWSPKTERNRLGGLSFAGADIGNLLAVAVGVIASTALGWPGIYYLTTVMCAIWLAMWLIFGANNARDSRYISTSELGYIETTTRRPSGSSEKKPPVPWRAIFSSKPFLAIIIARVGQNWLVGITGQQMPTYLNGIMNLEINANSLLSALPFAIMFFNSLLCTAVADLIQLKGLLSLRTLRRCFNTLSTALPAVGCLVIGFLDTGKTTVAVICLIVMIAGNSPHVIGSLLNLIDLSPNHASVIMSINSFACCLTLSCMPLLVGLIVEDVHNRQQWQIIFVLTAIVISFCNLCFILLMSVELQPWDNIDYERNRTRSNN